MADPHHALQVAAARRLWPSAWALKAAALNARSVRGLARASGLPGWAITALAAEYGVEVKAPTGHSAVSWDDILAPGVQQRIAEVGSVAGYARQVGVSRQALYQQAQARGVVL